MKDDLAYIEHILDAISRILKYTKRVDFQEFEKSDIIQDAVIRNFEIVGEATKNVSNKMVLSSPAIPWKEMAGLRDKLIHDYMGIELRIIWKTIQEDIPELESLLKNLLSNKE